MDTEYTSKFFLLTFFRTYDPRAKILKEMCHDLFKRLNINDPLFEVAVKLEELALQDDYFI